MTVELVPIGFATDTTAAVVWDDDHARTQRRFLAAINSNYFRYQARI